MIVEFSGSGFVYPTYQFRSLSPPKLDSGMDKFVYYFLVPVLFLLLYSKILKFVFKLVDEVHARYSKL